MYFPLFKILLLVGLTRFLVATPRPFLCSGIYTVVVSSMFLLLGVPLLNTLIAAAIIAATSSLYFWLLNYFSDSLVVYFAVLFLGLAIGLV